MMEPDKTDDDAARIDVTKGDAGDVEAAGETTAAVMIGGPPDTRLVGEDTLANVKIAGAEDRTGNDSA